ncbi:MAG: DUF4342 domain-containing protein [Bacteroidota bacterium]
MDSSSRPSLDDAKAAGERTFHEAKAVGEKTLQEIKVAGSQLVDKVRDLIEEGNVRRIAIKKDERTLLEIPLTVGVGAGAAAVLLTPMLAALGAIAALVTDITLVIERDEPDTEARNPAPGLSPDEDTPNENV